MTAADERFLGEALALAETGLGLAAPNPAVGCLVVAEGRVVGRGSHRFAGRDHAEVIALREAGESARGGTVYLSLEPCSSRGRTPPCTEALARAGVSRVVAAVADPDPRHRGQGFARLRESGIEANWGPPGLRRRALVLNEHFAQWRLSGRPFVTLKAAASLDGRTAAAGGESRWITGAEAREAGHEARRSHASILCGVATVLADDPALTVRLPQVAGVEPLRIVLDPGLRTPPTARFFDGEGGPVLLVTETSAARGPQAEALLRAGAELLPLPLGAEGFDLRELLRVLGAERSVDSVLVEGGGTTTGRFLAAGLGDEVLVFLAPLLLGGASAQAAAFAGFAAQGLADGRRLADLRVRRVGDDLELRGRLPGGFDPDRLLAELSALMGETR